jgi:hypothetical protein
LQIVPSTWPEQFEAAVGGAAQLPSCWPAAISQTEEQHSESCEHTSPICTQNDEARLQWPALHSCEQHCPLSLHSLPAVLQLVLSAVQVF